VPDTFGGKVCTNDPAYTHLHNQTEPCNTGVGCGHNDLPQCQDNHVHCEIRNHHVERDAGDAWRVGRDSEGRSYYRNILTGQNRYDKPKELVECASPLPQKYVQDAVHSRDINKHDTFLYNPHGTFTKYRTGHFETPATMDCINNQNCGLVDLGSCHGCDTEEECRDVGVSSTLFVTHERLHMNLTRYDAATSSHSKATYHCKRVGAWGAHTCNCTCDAHPPCVERQGFVLRECADHKSAHGLPMPHAHALTSSDTNATACNRMLHGNAFPNVPDIQDCCDMCTNHPDCGAWEYSSSNMCVLKAGKPAFQRVHLTSGMVWAGCPSGEAC